VIDSLKGKDGLALRGAGNMEKDGGYGTLSGRGNSLECGEDK
jgi:hypothetical protein